MANKNPLKIIKRPVAYASGYENIPTKAQDRAKQLCCEYNRTAPNEKNRRRAILQELERVEHIRIFEEVKEWISQMKKIILCE